jgi:biopolymer transport protein ExbD
MDEKEFDYMNVIPFVDIMLVLLTIVLMTSTFVAGGVIPLELPRASQNETGEIRSQIIEIDRQGKIFFNSNPVTIHTLKESIDGVDRAASILIRADKNIALEAFVEILDLVKSNGFKKIQLQTETGTA